LFERIDAFGFSQIMLAGVATYVEPYPMSDTNHELSEDGEDRRSFLKSCGKFAAVTPPVVSILLSTSLNSDAIARSGGSYGGGRRHGGGRGRGHHHHHHGHGRGRR
jgi:hypothetical protein